MIRRPAMRHRVHLRRAVRRRAAAALLVLAVIPTAAFGIDPLNFDNGTGTSSVDAFPGVAGGGWTTPWSLSPGLTGAPQVLADAPLTAGGGNYLSVDLTGDDDRNVIRRYGNTADFNSAAPHAISWQWRLDEPLDVTNQYDRINFFANASPSAGSTTSSNSWIIGVAPTLMGFDNWYFYDRQVDSSFGPANAVNTGIALAEDVTYSFSIELDPAAGLYNASISDGTHFFAAEDLRFRSGGGSSTYLHFGGKASSGSKPLSYSLDSIAITGGDGDPQLPVAQGFRGIWYSNQRQTGQYEQYGYKYSGGFGVYPQQMRPQAYYAAAADKTFFTYGGTNENNSDLYHMVSYFDHATGQVARPKQLLAKGTTDAHDNPTIMLDDAGYVYIFSASHGTARPAYINRSTEPHSIEAFEEVLALPSNNNFSYSQPLYVEGQGFLFLHTQYTSYGRTLKFNTSSDGVNWDHPWASRPTIAQIQGGQYQVSEVHGQTVGTAFNRHPGGNVNARTNLYYMETSDFGQTWQTADGTNLTTPVTTVGNDALVHDYAAEGKLVYLKDIQYDAHGNPVLLYLTSEDWHPGPTGDPRTWTIARHQQGAWEINELFTSDHNYDHGSLYIEPGGVWRIIAPTADGPQPWGTGGDMVLWTSRDDGQSWQEEFQLTHGSQFNHSYARRPVNAHDDFYALWADGNPLEVSESRFYYADRTGTGVWQLPWTMEGDFAAPELVYTPLLLSRRNTVGDFDEDGLVDGSDFLAWQREAGGIVDPAGDGADGTGDGVVDGDDKSLWEANYGRTLPTDAAARQAPVPEPEAGVLFWHGALLIVRKRPSRLIPSSQR